MVITNDSKFELNLLIQKKTNKVLFAEVRKDVVDFLFRLLSLPVGSLTKLITEESAYGALRNIYCSWEQLDHSFLYSTPMTAKSLIPVISPTSNSSNFVNILSSAIPATVKDYIYLLDCKCNKNFTDVRQIIYCKSCSSGRWCSPFSYVGSNVTREAIERDGYVKDGFTYAVMDDLSMVPMMPLSFIELLHKMGHKDLSLMDKKTVSLEVQQGLELLKTSFRSKNVLTVMFLSKKKEGQAEEANCFFDEGLNL